jgi:hypothetical protein
MGMRQMHSTAVRVVTLATLAVFTFSGTPRA